MSFDIHTAAGQMNVFLLVFCGLVMLSALIRGFRRRTGRALLRLITVAGAAVVAAMMMHHALAQIGTYDLAGTIGSIQNMPADVADTLRELKATLPAVYQLVVGIPMALLVPSVYVFVFFALSLVFGIPYLLLAAIFFPRRRRSPILFSRLWGTLIGAVQGVIVCAVYVIPMVGYAFFGGTLADGIGNAAADNEAAQSAVSSIKDYTQAVTDNKIASTLYKMGGDKLFRYLTTFTYHDGENTTDICLVDETGIYSAVLRDILPLTGGKQLKEYTQKEVDAIRALAADLRNSRTMTVAVSGILSEGCKAWDRGETFFGVARPQPEDEKSERMLQSAIETFKDSTPETVSDDLEALADTFAVMVRYDFFAALDDPDLLAEKFKDETFIKELMDAMSGSEHLKKLMHETVKIGVQTVCEEFVEKASGSEAYNDTVGEICGNLADKLNGMTGTDEEKKNALTASIKSAMTENGVAEEDVPETMLGYVSQFVLDEFAEKDTVTAEDLMNYFGFTLRPTGTPAEETPAA